MRTHKKYAIRWVPVIEFEVIVIADDGLSCPGLWRGRQITHEWIAYESYEETSKAAALKAAKSLVREYTDPHFHIRSRGMSHATGKIRLRKELCIMYQHWTDVESHPARLIRRIQTSLAA
jgi:hypothetical protein